MTTDVRVVGVWRGAERAEALDASDRGLAYGDGLFETMRAHAGTLPWWPRHRARLLDGAHRLGLALPADGLLDAAVDEALAAAPDAVVKLLLTRGAGARGYAPAAGYGSTLVVTTAPQPAAPGEDAPVGPQRAAARARPIAVDTLSIRLGVQPALAGIKHLNRLEQVLGAREAAERGLDDGLMADAEGYVTCSTRANLFAWIDGRWITPPVERAGVAGIARGVLLDAWALPDDDGTTGRGASRVRRGVDEVLLPIDALSRAQALFLTNAVRGILVVGRLGARALDVRPPGLDAARAALAASHPAFRES